MKSSTRRSKSNIAGKLAAPTSEKVEATYRKTVLPNGLRIVSEEIPHVRSVSVGVWINTGSRDEHDKNNGISHFIEHMVFKGTKNRSVKDIAQSIESVGGYLNAFTGKEHTCYYARVLDENTELAVDVLSDMVLHATFPEKELEKEKGVVIEELKNLEDDPDDLIHDVFERAIFGQHPLGFPVIGTEKNLRAFNRSDLLDHRSGHYASADMVVAAAGRINHEQVVDLTNRYLALRPKHSKNGIGSRTRPKAQTSIRTDLEKPIQQAHVCLGTVGLSIKSKQRYPLMVMNSLLGDGMSSRLFQNIREKYGFAYSVYSFANMMADSGTFGAYIGTDAMHVDQSIDLIWKELKTLRSKPVPRAELNRTKQQLKGSMMLSLESIPSRMMRLGSSELYFGALTSLDEIIKRIDAVTPDHIEAVANDLFVEEKFATIIFRPGDKKTVRSH